MSLDLVQPPDRAAGLSYIEQVQVFESLECETPGRPVIVGRNDELKIAVVYRPRCKLWSCPVCAQINKTLWAFIAGYGTDKLQRAGKECRFVSLTSHEKLGPERSLAIFPKAWKKLRSRLAYAWPGFQYVVVPERHEDGRLHVHGVIAAPVTERFLKNKGRECGLGYMADSQPIDSIERVISYISKHIARQLEDQAWPENFRRVRTSQKWPRPDPDESVEFRWFVCESEADVAVEAEVLRREGYRVIEGGHRTTWRTWEVIRPLVMLQALSSFDGFPPAAELS